VTRATTSITAKKKRKYLRVSSFHTDTNKNKNKWHISST